MSARDELREAAYPSRNGLGELDVVTASSVTPTNVRWHWQGWLPLGMTSLLVGLPGLGKTTLALKLAADATRGALDGALNGQPTDVIVASLEDPAAQRLVPMLMAANADLDRVHLVGCTTAGAVLDLTRHLPEIDQLAADHGARLIIVDPLVATLPAQKVDSHRDQGVRSVLAPLASLAERRDLAALGLMHFSKSAVDALLGVGGSIGFVGAARSVLVFGADPGDERGEEGPARVLAHRKCNLGRRQKSRAVHVLAKIVDTDSGEVIETSGVVLGDEVDVDADELVRVRDRSEPPIVQATKFLRHLLSDGPHRATEIHDLAADDGISEKTLKRAKRDLNVDSFRKDNVWWWVLPDPDDDEEPEDDPEAPE